MSPPTENDFIILHLDQITTMAMIGNLQLALRHPENTGPTSKIVRTIVATLATIVQNKCPDLDPRVFEEWRGEGYLCPSRPVS